MTISSFPKISVLLLSAIILFAAFQNVSAQTEASEFLQMEQKIETAIVNNDLEYLKTVYADDFRFAHGTGLVQNKSEWLKSVANGKYISRTASENEVELHGDIAITAARLDVARRLNNGEDKFWIKYIRVYRKVNDKWQMISHRTTQQTRL